MNGKSIAIVVIACILSAGIGYWCGIHCDGHTADTVRNQIDTTKINQQSITVSVGSASQAIAESGKIIDELIDGLRQVRRQPAPEN